MLTKSNDARELIVLSEYFSKAQIRDAGIMLE